MGGSSSVVMRGSLEKPKTCMTGCVWEGKTGIESKMFKIKMNLFIRKYMGREPSRRRWTTTKLHKKSKCPSPETLFCNNFPPDAYMNSWCSQGTEVEDQTCRLFMEEQRRDLESRTPWWVKRGTGRGPAKGEQKEFFERQDILQWLDSCSHCCSLSYIKSFSSFYFEV
jgi:hypothetical protein